MRPLSKRQIFWTYLIAGTVLGTGAAILLFKFYKIQMPQPFVERHVQSHITPAELRAWATNLLAQFPPGETNYLIEHVDARTPAALREAWKYVPAVMVLEGWQFNDGNDRPCVKVVWSSGVLGAWGLIIGETNFVTSSGRKWDDGIFWFRSP